MATSTTTPYAYGELLWKEGIISHNQMLHLGVAGVTLVEAQGPGTVIQFVDLTICFKCVSPYSGGNTCDVEYAGIPSMGLTVGVPTTLFTTTSTNRVAFDALDPTQVRT